MGKLIRMEDFKYTWKEVFSCDGSTSTLQVYVDGSTGEAEIVQSNDDGECIRTPLSARDLYDLVDILARKRIISNEKV